MSKKEQILKILKGNIFISKDIKEKILGEIDQLNDKQMDALWLMLTEAQEKQDMMIEKISEEDPDFKKKLQNLDSEEN